MPRTNLFLSILIAAVTLSTAQSNPASAPALMAWVAAPAPVLLGTSGNYVILAKTGISTTGTTSITGDIGVSPAAGCFITGFSLLAPPTTYATSAKVTGKVYAADYDSPTPANLTTAVLDMGTAYTDAAARPFDYTELGTGNIGGMTLAPAVYRWSGNVTLPSNVTLSAAQTMCGFSRSPEISLRVLLVNVFLQGGALAKNIYWQVAGSVSLGTTSHFEGIILAQTAIALNTGASANARFLTKTAVTLDANSVVQPNTPTAIAVPKNSTRSFMVEIPGSRISFPIAYGVKSRVSIVDLWGRTLLSTIVTPSEKNRNFVWNGKNKNGAQVAQGSYRAMITPLK